MCGGWVGRQHTTSIAAGQEAVQHAGVVDGGWGEGGSGDHGSGGERVSEAEPWCTGVDAYAAIL